MSQEAHNASMSALIFFAGLGNRRIQKTLLLIGLGFSSGLPFLLTLSTLSAWLTEVGVSLTAIGLFVLVTLPYTFKFFLGPFVDQVRIPYLTIALGKRRAFALVAQVALILCLFALGATSPQTALWTTALMAFCVSLCAALQDLVLEAYRVETTHKDSRGTAAWAVSLGFRLGLMVSGAGALYLAAYLSWFGVYCLMACCVLPGMVTVLLCPKPDHERFLSSYPTLRFVSWRLFWIRGVRRLLSRQTWPVFVIWIFLYKLGDTVINVMNVPFLMELGYGKLEIAEIAKFCGTSALIVGGIAAGAFLNYLGLWRGMMITLILQVISLVMCAIQAYVGYNPAFLICVVAIENVTCGLSITVLVAYLTSLTRPPYTATQYALLASLGSAARLLWSIVAGFLADWSSSWTFFFMGVAVASLPGLYVTFYYRSLFQALWEEGHRASRQKRLS